MESCRTSDSETENMQDEFWDNDQPRCIKVDHSAWTVRGESNYIMGNMNVIYGCDLGRFSTVGTTFFNME